MKYQINKFWTLGFVFLIMGIGKINAQKVVSDPVLTGTIIGTNEAEKKILKGILKENKKIVGLQTTITYNLNKMKQYEEKIYNYLSNVSTAINQAIEIKQAAEITADIIKSFKTCAEAAKKNPQGLVYTTIVSRKTSKLTTEMGGVYSYISSIALNKNALLNTVERQIVIDGVLYKLRRIRSEMYLLEFQISNYTLADLPEVLFPEQYFMFIDGKRIADKIIRDMSKER